MLTASADASVQARINDEKAVIGFMCALAIGKGLLVTVFNGDSNVVIKSADLTEIMTNIMQTDEDVFRFYPLGGGQCVGAVYAVYGNSGPEVINDYSSKLENQFMFDVSQYAERMEEARSA